MVQRLHAWVAGAARRMAVDELSHKPDPST
jgi:hypothetical protein